MTFLDPYCNQIVIVISAVKPDVISRTWFLRCHKVRTGQNVLICLFVHIVCVKDAIWSANTCQLQAK